MPIRGQLPVTGLEWNQPKVLLVSNSATIQRLRDDAEQAATRQLNECRIGPGPKNPQGMLVSTGFHKQPNREPEPIKDAHGAGTEAA